MDWATTDWAGTPVVTTVGEKIPAISLDYGFGPDQETVNLSERCAVGTCACVPACTLAPAAHSKRKESQGTVGLTL